MIMKWPVRLFPVCLLMLDTLSRLQPRLQRATEKLLRKPYDVAPE